jgi:phosphatidylinositol alpha-1,6-mannosyltransferase
MQRVAQELLAALQGHGGVEVTPLVLRTSWRWTHVRTPFFLLRLLRDIPRRANAARVDVVLFSSMVTASTAPFLRRYLGRSGPSLASIVHGRDVTLPVRLYQRLVPRIFGALDGVLAVSQATGQACLDRGLSRAKLRVVPNGVDPERFAGAGGPLTSHLSPGSFGLLSVGRHVERKGFVWFVDQVMPRLPADVHYLLVGEGPTTGAIQAAVARHGLWDRVHLLGKVSEDELGVLYRSADLFVMPNLPVPGDLEGFGLVLAEAVMYGLPAVAANLEGIRDVVQDGETGTLVASGDAAGFADAILRYRDPQLRATAGQRAARHARERFAWSVAVERYVEALAEIRGGGSPASSVLVPSTHGVA